MTFLSDLRRELGARGIRGRLADRIDAELADHLACDPGAQLGAPAEIAERFAIELRLVRTRRATLGTFLALAVCAALLAVSGQSHAPGHPFAGLAIVAGGQVAFVAACLALIRAFRGRTPGDFRLAQRRAVVALAAGAVVAAGLVGELRTTTYVCAAVATVALAVAASATRRAHVLTPVGPASGLSSDLGRHAAVVLYGLGGLAVALIVVQGVVFEGSGWEGVIRGAVEAGGLGLGVGVLGRVLGLRA